MEKIISLKITAPRIQPFGHPTVFTGLLSHNLHVKLNSIETHFMAYKDFDMVIFISQCIFLEYLVIVGD